MAIDGTGESGSDHSSQGGGSLADEDVTVGEYTWDDLRRDHHTGGRFDRSEFLGFEPQRIRERLTSGAEDAKTLATVWDDYRDPEATPVRKDVYTWEHFKGEYYYEEDGAVPRDGDGEKIPFDAEEYLGFDPDHTENKLAEAGDVGDLMSNLLDEHTVDVNPDLDEDEFFSTQEGNTTVVNRYDLERSVPLTKKSHFQEVERYWVNKPYACVVLFHSSKENEKKYYVVEPHLNGIENDLREFLSGKLKTAIKYSEDDVIVQGWRCRRAKLGC